MARARTIKPNFLRSHSMRAVSPLARLTFIQLWLVADDAGRLNAFPRQLAHRLYSGDKEAIGLLPSRLPARPEGFSKDSGALQETFGRESEKPSSDKALSPAAQIPERFEKPLETFGRNPQNPCAPGLSPTFPNDSRKNGGFIWRVASVARRALARVGSCRILQHGIPLAAVLPADIPAGGTSCTSRRR